MPGVGGAQGSQKEVTGGQEVKRMGDTVRRRFFKGKGGLLFVACIGHWSVPKRSVLRRSFPFIWSEAPPTGRGGGLVRRSRRDQGRREGYWE